MSRKPSIDAVAEPLANETRGEVDLELDGRTYVLRPSYAAIDAFERAAGKGLMALYTSAASGVMPVSDAAMIVTHCIRAQGEAIGDALMKGVGERRIGELLVEAEGGMMLVLIRLQRLLLTAATGGYNAKGEVKAAPGTIETPAAA